mmetsp:Transcript_483/g.823  ORF Transcript_483/g.823 Transcript_483/m.823 type:complete len:137 (+) Transcript_483:4697-5107(+)
MIDHCCKDSMTQGRRMELQMRAIKMRLDSVWRGEFDGKKDSNGQSDSVAVVVCVGRRRTSFPVQHDFVGFTALCLQSSLYIFSQPPTRHSFWRVRVGWYKILVEKISRQKILTCFGRQIRDDSLEFWPLHVRLGKN